jgi:hypothetical protein
VSAKPGPVVKPKSLHLRAALPASNGYSVSLKTNGHRQVVVTVSKDEFIASYTALGKVTRKGIEADFGSFGQVSLRFRSKSRFRRQSVLTPYLPPSLRNRCKGRAPIGERGVFVGNVRFRGEHDFIAVRAHRLKGRVVRSYRRVCKKNLRAAASVKVREDDILLGAEAQSHGTLRFLLAVEISVAIKDENSSLSIAFGGLREKVGRVGVSKLQLLFDEFDSIQPSPLGRRPVTAEVKLPKPFEGTASYFEEGKTPSTWSGDLNVRLPGSGLVPLTGPEFEANLCRGSSSEEFARCLQSLLKESPLAQGSGSHSQPLALARLSSLR